MRKRSNGNREKDGKMMFAKSSFRIFLGAIFVLWVTSDVFAADHKLAMSKQEDVCQAMLGLANEGLLKAESLDHPEALDVPEVNFVVWETTKRAPSLQEHNGTIEGALFDINNDDKVDWVVRIQWALGGLYSHELGVYSMRREFPFQNSGFDEKSLSKADARMTLMGQQYSLTEIPKRQFKDGKSAYFNIVAAYLIPFRFKNGTYILIANPFALHELLQDRRRFAVVAKYLPRFQLMDVCYIEEIQNKVKN